jgi:protocatechuate 3,4-dioxygenase beta subunit
VREEVSPAMSSLLATCATSKSWAEQDEGPYHRDEAPLRRNVVEDRDGVVLELGIRLAHEDGSPVADAAVEIWQCDALGRYSGFPPPDDTAVVTASSAPRGRYQPDQSFLRGRQQTDPAGMVEFRTIYPGWYPGRTVHIHLLARVGGVTLISQLYFPDDVTDRVLSLEPYARRPNRDTTNETDEIFPTGGEAAVLDVAGVGADQRAAICLVLPGPVPARGSTSSSVRSWRP